MFENKKKSCLFRSTDHSFGTIDTLIGPKVKIEGHLEAEGNIRVEGKVNGNINTSGSVTIGEDAYILGNVSAAAVELNGSVEGNITCKGMLRMSSSSKLFGDIEVESLVSDQGALFRGSCTMINPIPPAGELDSTIKDLKELMPHESDDMNSRNDSKKNRSGGFKKSSILNNSEDKK